MNRLKKYKFWQNICVLTVLLMLCLLSILPAEPSPYQSHNGYLGETVDTMTGALVLSSTDVSLPGRGGTGIQIVRSYNNKHYKTENSLHHLSAGPGTDVLIPKKTELESRTISSGAGRYRRSTTTYKEVEVIDRDNSPWGWLKYGSEWTPESAGQFTGYAGQGWQFSTGGVLFLTEYSFWSDKKITKQDDIEVKDIVVQLGGGQSYYFDSRTLQPKDARVKAKLTKVKDGYTLRDASGTVYYFTNKYFQKKMDTYEYRDDWDDDGKDGDEFIYGKNGDSQGYLLTRVENPYGDWTEYVYEEKAIFDAGYAVDSGRYLYYKEAKLVKAHNSLGNETNIGYNQDNQIVELSYTGQDGMPLVWRYEYDKDKQLTKAVNPRGEATEYTYKVGKDFVPGIIATVRSPLGAESGYTYYWQNLGNDNLNNYTVRTKKLTAEGKEYLWKYEHLNGHTYDIGNGKQFCFGETTITDPRNIKTTHYYKNGYPIREFLPDQVLAEYEWDYKTGNKLKEITVKGTKRYVTEYQDYDTHGNPGRIINYGDSETSADDKVMVNEYLHNTGQAAGNGYGAITTADALEKFLVKQIVHSYVSEPNSKEKHNEVYFRYDPKGNLARKEVLVTDEKNNSQTIITAYTYDTHGELESKTMPDGLIVRYRNDYRSNEYTAREERPDGGWTQKTFGKRTGLLLREEDSYGNEMRYEYDRYGFQTKKQDRKRNLEEKNSYTLIPNSGAEYTSTDVYGHEQKTILDQAGRKKRTEFRYKDGGQTKITQYEYHDKAPQLLAKATDYANRTTETRYDSMDRPILQINFDGTYTETRYNDLLNYKEVYDVKSQKITYHYDAYGNLIKTIQPNGAVTEYQYNIYGKLDKLITHTDSGNKDRDTISIIEYKYDSINRLIEIRKGASVTKMEYDNMDNVIRKTLPDNQTIEYSYDTLNRPLKTQYHDKTKGTQTEEYKYYTDNDNIGRLRSIKDYTGTTTYEYDKYGNIEKVTREQYGQKRSTNYKYDIYGKLEHIQYPGLTDKIVYNYDNRQRLREVASTSLPNGLAVSDLSRQKLVEYEYTQDIHERLDRQVYGNGAITQYGYDGHDRINSIEARTREGQNIFKQEYRYDELGNRAETQWSV
ncbi:putative Rhs family protein, partial [Candidatus Termititenax aidoneus]